MDLRNLKSYSCMNLRLDRNHCNDEIVLYSIQTHLDLDMSDNPISTNYQDSDYIVKGIVPRGHHIYLVPHNLELYIKDYIFTETFDNNFEMFFDSFMRDFNMVIDKKLRDLSMITPEVVATTHYTIESIKDRYLRIFIHLYSKHDELGLPLLFQDLEYKELFDLYDKCHNYGVITHD